jgi:uncharacterized protein YutE (UPF0331/DUF86 family)
MIDESRILRKIQTSIEAMIDICNHIIARKRLRIPATNV